MAKQSRGTLSGKTRFLRGRSRSTVAESVRTFKIGDKVLISPKASISGMPHLRYANRHGIVVEKRGRSYVVEVKDGKKTKKLVTGPIHMRKVG